MPNAQTKIEPRNPPWITGDINMMIKRQNRMFKNYKQHGFLEEDKIRVDKFRDDCNAAILEAKDSYLKDLPVILTDRKISQNHTGRLLINY